MKSPNQRNDGYDQVRIDAAKAKRIRKMMMRLVQTDDQKVNHDAEAS